MVEGGVTLSGVDGEEALDEVLDGGAPSTYGRGGNETILLVDDDDQVRVLVQFVLKSAGYTVLQANRADLAFEISEKYHGHIDLLLTDVVMPGLNGRQLAEHLKTIRPTMRELYMSGYVSDSIIRYGMMSADVPFIQKPFSPSNLVKVVRNLLDQA